MILQSARMVPVFGDVLEDNMPRASKRHKTEQRKAEYIETYCAHAGCNFEGQRAVQGTCYSNKGEVLDWDLVDKAERDVAEELNKVKKEYGATSKKYIRWLEAMYECSMANWTITLDECVRLRRNVAHLKAGLEIQRGKKART